MEMFIRGVGKAGGPELFVSQTGKKKLKHHRSSHFPLTWDVVTAFSGLPEKKEQRYGVDLVAKCRKTKFIHITIGTGIINRDFCR